MKGLTFVLHKDKKDQTSLGYERIHVQNEHICRVISNDGMSIYEYRLDCLAYQDDGVEYIQLDKDEFCDEIASGIYILENHRE